MKVTGVRTRFLLAFSILLVSAISISATAAGGQKQATDPIFIGIAAAKTGFLGSWDGEQGKSFQLAAAEINKAGGILGRQIKIEWIDTKTDRPTSANAGRQLLDKGADMLLVTCDLDYGAPAAIEAQKSGKVSMSFCAGDPKMADAKTVGKNVFTFGSGGDESGAALAEWAYKVKKWRNAYSLTDTSLDIMKNISASFKARWLQLGGKIVGEDQFVGGATVNVDTQVTRLKAVASRADFVSVSSYLPPGGEVIRAIRGAGIKTPLTHGGVSIYGPVLTQIAGKVSNYWTFPYACVVDCTGQPNPKLKAFMAKWKAKYGKLPETASHPILAYDLAYLMKNAITRAKGVDTNRLTKALETTKVKLPLEGMVTMSPKCHRPIRRTLVVIRYTNGKAKFQQFYRVAKVPNLGDGNPCVGL